MIYGKWREENKTKKKKLVVGDTIMRGLIMGDTIMGVDPMKSPHSRPMHVIEGRSHLWILNGVLCQGAWNITPTSALEQFSSPCQLHSYQCGSSSIGIILVRSITNPMISEFDMLYD